LSNPRKNGECLMQEFTRKEVIDIKNQYLAKGFVLCPNCKNRLDIERKTTFSVDSFIITCRSCGKTGDNGYEFSG
jgi:ribosomal protein S27E